jgi:hypothetical protein
MEGHLPGTLTLWGKKTDMWLLFGVRSHCVHRNHFSCCQQWARVCSLDTAAMTTVSCVFLIWFQDPLHLPTHPGSFSLLCSSMTPCPLPCTSLSSVLALFLLLYPTHCASISSFVFLSPPRNFLKAGTGVHLMLVG